MSRTKIKHGKGFEAWFNSRPPIVLTVFAVLAYMIGQATVPVLLFYFSDRLGVWWLILLVLYIGALIAGTALIWHRKEMRVLRANYGDEFYFKAYPREKKREERRERRRTEREKRRAELKEKTILTATNNKSFKEESYE